MRFEQQLKLADIDAELASKGRKVLAGKSGMRLLTSFVRARDSLSGPAAAAPASGYTPPPIY